MRRAVLVLAGVLAASPAGAAPVSFCVDAMLIERPMLGLGEHLVATWSERDGSVRMLFARPDGSAWTMIAVDVLRGMACTMREGPRIDLFEMPNERGV